MKSVYEMTIEEMMQMTLGESKELSTPEYAYVLEKLTERKVLKDEDVDLILAMSMI